MRLLRVPVCVAAGLTTGFLDAQQPIERELIRDPHFQFGFILLAPTPGNRVVLGNLPGHEPAEKPVWLLEQWSSQHPLALTPPQRLTNGSLRYANVAKAVTVGRPGTADADLTLAVKASTEYGTRSRKAGEPWVHLLVEQDLRSPPALGHLASARLQVQARLRASQKISTPDYTPTLHAAQFQIFFSVQNLNHQSPGYGQYLWFGIPLYDDRQRMPPAHKARDTGGTRMFIFTPAGDTYTTRSAHDCEWIAVDKDLLPLMREGLQTAWQQGFLNDSRALADYRIAGMNLGWELPGVFDVEMQVRNLSLKIILKP